MNFKFKAALVAALSLAPFTASAFDGPELYDGEQALYEKAQEEGLIVSFYRADLGKLVITIQEFQGPLSGG